MKASVEYISTNCGRTPTAVDCGPSNLVAFSAKNALAILRTGDESLTTRIVNTFAEHTDRINSVRWVRRGLTGEFDDKIITGSADKTAIVWTKKDDAFVKLHHLVGHDGAVNVVDALNVAALYAATASVDSSIRIWKIDCDGKQYVQTLELGKGLCLTLQLFMLPNTKSPLLACGMHDNNVHLYGETINNQYECEFKKLQILSGHEDWVRGIDFIRINDHKVMLATCSQDTFIRLWSIDYFVCDKSAYRIRIEKTKFSVDNTVWAISLDAVLSGHENAVYSVHWHFKRDTDERYRLKLLSASFDKSLIIWETEDNNSVWMEKVRVGEVGGGGLGFYGGKFTEDGRRVIGHGYSGSFHIWKHDIKCDKWEPDVPCGGHFEEITDLAWDPKGQYVITVSADKTTRIHAPWIDNGDEVTWHEIARPQVHGYDMSSLAIVSRFCFASGAEEKVIRTFEAPQNFLENFQSISKVSPEQETKTNSLPEGASVPSLGLSNKAVYSNETFAVDINEKCINKQYTENRFIPTKLEAPPTEETLMQNTLWPEKHKLYGHGHEVYALAASKDGKLLASACKATKPHHAAIILWDTRSWVQTQSLLSHTLTVTQMSFSPDNSRLLSVSRDRRWSIFRRKSSEDNEFILEATTDKETGVHSRIIWCCDWSGDSLHFATGSRDGRVAVWTRNDSDTWRDFAPVKPLLNLKNDSVTALAFAPEKVEGYYVIAVGLESGVIEVYTIDPMSSEREWICKLKLDNNLAHHLTVKRLSFQPIVDKSRNEKSLSNSLKLASGSIDNCTKIYSLSF